MLSGETFCWTADRGGMTRPDHLYQGHLARKLVEMGHEVVVLTPTFAASIEDDGDGEMLSPAHEGVVYSPGMVPDESMQLDLLWVDRLNRKGHFFMDALQKIRAYRGPVIYFQTIFVPGYGPPLAEHTWILKDRKWLILNRAPKPSEMFKRGVFKEDLGYQWDVEFARWEPFLQYEALWNGELSSTHQEREYFQGYVGRLPQHDGRLNLVRRYLEQGRYAGWKRCVYSTSGQSIARDAGARHMGKAEQRNLRKAMETFSVTVNVPHPAFEGTGAWPNRIPEAVLGGVLVFNDAAGGITDELSPWTVEGPRHFRSKAVELLKDPGKLRDEIDKQRWATMPRLETETVLKKLRKIIKDHGRVTV